MPEGAAPLGWTSVAVAAAFVLIAGLISLGLGLRLERSLATGVVRATLQLTAVGYALTWIFDHLAVALTLSAMIVMTLLASRAALRRAGWKLEGGFAGVFVTLVATSGMTALVASGVLIGVQPWYAPRYALPLLGMLLGNGLTGLSLCLDSLLAAFAEDAEAIETELALGATRWEAARGPVREAIRRGMIPILNAMTVVGIVSLPGMMTGQILAGADPLVAVRYQIVIMFMLAAATSFGCMLLALYAFARLFDDQHRLRAERIRAC